MVFENTDEQIICLLIVSCYFDQKGENVIRVVQNSKSQKGNDGSDAINVFIYTHIRMMIRETMARRVTSEETGGPDGERASDQRWRPFFGRKKGRGVATWDMSDYSFINLLPSKSEEREVVVVKKKKRGREKTHTDRLAVI